MTADSARGALILMLLAVAAPVAARGQDAPVQNFHIDIDHPIYTHLPVWIVADLRYLLETHYPAASDDPGDSGPSRLEVRRDDYVLSRCSAFYAGSNAPRGEGKTVNCRLLTVDCFQGISFKERSQEVIENKR